jgi:hypothetical protein
MGRWIFPQIRAYAFTSEVKTGDTLASLEHWRPHEYALRSYFIASLRDDVRRMSAEQHGIS